MVVPRTPAERPPRSSMPQSSSPRIVELSKRNIKRLIVYRNGGLDSEARNLIIPQSYDWDKLLDECTKSLYLPSRAKKIWTYDGVPISSIHDVGDQTRICVGLPPESFKRPSPCPGEISRIISMKSRSSVTSPLKAFPARIIRSDDCPSRLSSSMDGLSLYAFDEIEESMFSITRKSEARSPGKSDLTLRFMLPVARAPSRDATPPGSPPKGAQITPVRSPCLRSIELCISPLSPIRKNIDETASSLQGPLSFTPEKHTSPEEVGCRDCTKRLFTDNPAPFPSQQISPRISSGKPEAVFDTVSRAPTKIPRPAISDGKDEKEDDSSIHLKKIPQLSSQIPAPKIRPKVASAPEVIANVGVSTSSTVAEIVSENMILVNETAPMNTSSSQDQIKAEAAPELLPDCPLDPFPEEVPSVEQVPSPEYLDPSVQVSLDADDFVKEEDPLPTPKIIRRISASRRDNPWSTNDCLLPLPREASAQCQETQNKTNQPVFMDHGQRRRSSECAPMTLRLLLRGLCVFAVATIVCLVANVEVEVPY